MKKLFIIVLMLFIALGTISCGNPSTTEDLSTSTPTEVSTESTKDLSTTTTTDSTEITEEVELIIFAAASMTETLEEISTLYSKVEPNVKLTFNFDSSGTLKTQIQEGAECDLFISAGQKQMDELDITAPDTVNTEQLDFVMESTRMNLLENKVTLVVSEGNPAGLKTFDDLASALSDGEILMAMGNSDVPVGQYTQKILQYYNLDEQALSDSGKISYGTNVKEVTTQVSESSVDCGVVYCTDAFSAKLDILDYATSEMCGRIIYPAAVLKDTKNKEAASTFLNYLTSDEAMAVFESVGFSKP